MLIKFAKKNYFRCGRSTGISKPTAKQLRKRMPAGFRQERSYLDAEQTWHTRTYVSAKDES